MATTTYAEQVEALGFDIDIRAEFDDIPVRGNALASGDDAEDRAAEDEIIARLEAGDVWAWARVRVTVTHPDMPGLDGWDSLGACSYRDEADFIAGGYYDDMVREALRNLIESSERVRRCSDLIDAANELI